MPTATEIAAALHDAVDARLFAEKTTYYRVQRDCLSLAKGASGLDAVVLSQAARIAETLARELEGDAIAASYVLLWRRYAAELEKIVCLVGSGLAADDVMARLAAATAAIGTPESGL